MVSLKSAGSLPSINGCQLPATTFSSANPYDSQMTKHPPPHIIAVVDDDPSLLQSIRILLESEDHVVRLFASAAVLLESGCLADTDCVISDITMPVMNGLDLLEAIHASFPGLPVIFVTGHPEMLDGLALDGSQHFRAFTKPFKGQELLAAIRDAVQ
jgi:FixJ family two-component response regulator